MTPIESTPSGKSASDPAHGATVVYQFTCPIDPLVEVNSNGCGWERAQSDDDIDAALACFSGQEELKAIKDMLAQTDGQHLAQYMDEPAIKKMDIFMRDSDCAQFYLHCDRALTQEELKAVHDRLRGQLSDGYGESFEQMDFGLEDSHSRRDIDYKLGFSFAYKRLSEACPYDASKMPALDEIKAFVDETSGPTRRAPRP